MTVGFMEILLERDSVCAGDDCDAPHRHTLAVKESATLEDVVNRIVKINYLAKISGDEATWVVVGDKPIAVIAQQWRKPRFLVDEYRPFREYIHEKIHVRYLAQKSPEDVFNQYAESVLESLSIYSRLSGVLLGTAVGDALGLPREGLSPRRAKRLFPGPLRHRFLFGYGMLSDDTEHTFMVAQSLLDAPTGAEAFARRLAWRLRFWFLSLPAGVGMATARATLKLWLGFSPKRSGVFSAGNGPAMRSALFGAMIDDAEIRHEFVNASTCMTHTDPKAFVGAKAVAETVAFITRRNRLEKPSPDDFAELLRNIAPEDATWIGLVDSMMESWHADDFVLDFASKLGLRKGVSGYVYHTVPVAIYAWLRHYGDFRQTLETLLECGGDTDTVAAIGGALAGATVGESGIPPEWIAGIRDCPISVRSLKHVADRLTRLVETGVSPGSVRSCWPLSLPRNLFFLLIVLGHGLRRLAPPY